MNKSNNFLTIMFFHYRLKPKEVSFKELQSLQQKWKESRIAKWYYQGSKDNFDYLIFFDYDLSIKKKYIVKYKIKKGHVNLLKKFNYTNRKKKWKVLPWGPKSYLRGI